MLVAWPEPRNAWRKPGPSAVSWNANDSRPKTRPGKCRARNRRPTRPMPSICRPSCAAWAAQVFSFTSRGPLMSRRRRRSSEHVTNNRRRLKCLHLPALYAGMPAQRDQPAYAAAKLCAACKSRKEIFSSHSTYPLLDQKTIGGRRCAHQARIRSRRRRSRSMMLHGPTTRLVCEIWGIHRLHSRDDAPHAAPLLGRTKNWSSRPSSPASSGGRRQQNRR